MSPETDWRPTGFWRQPLPSAEEIRKATEAMRRLNQEDTSPPGLRDTLGLLLAMPKIVSGLVRRKLGSSFRRRLPIE